MRRATVLRGALLFLTPLIAFLPSGCDSTESPTSPTQVTPVRVTVFAVGTPINTLVVDVTADDIKGRLVYNLQVVEGVASGNVDVPAGEARTFSVTAYDDQHNVTHEGSATTDVRPGSNPPLKLKLKPVAGEIEVTVTFGDYTVLIDPSSATIEAAVSATLQLDVSVLDQDGDAIPSPQVTWATTDPSVATVTASGLVTGLTDGTVTIVASFDGVAGASQISITGFATPGGTFAVGGNVEGLSNSVTLQLGADVDEELVVTQNGPFSFATQQPDGSIYIVTVATQPPEQYCTVTNSSGSIAAADVTDVLVSCAPIPLPLELLVTEIMVDPDAVLDSRGEWIELYNYSASTVQLKGLTITDAAGNSFTVQEALLLEASDYVVFGAARSGNGGVTLDYEWLGSTFSLNNTGDEIVIENQEFSEVDTVVYDDTWPLVPGRSMNLDGSIVPDAAANDVAENWCSTSTSLLPDGDYGTPGVSNENC